MPHARQFAALPAQPKRIDVESKLRRLRQCDRTIANVHATVRAGISSKPTLIRDVSDGGLGLIGADGLFPGCEVRVALVTGETKTGIVRWWLAGACGVQFHEPLQANDAFRNAVLRKSTDSGQKARKQLPIASAPGAQVSSLLTRAKTPK